MTFPFLDMSIIEVVVRISCSDRCIGFEESGPYPVSSTYVATLLG